jgi:hypothetical protein
MKNFDSIKALEDLEILIKELTTKKTMASHYVQVKSITNYLEGIYNQGLKDGFKEAQRANNLKI